MLYGMINFDHSFKLETFIQLVMNNLDKVLNMFDHSILFNWTYAELGCLPLALGKKSVTGFLCWRRRTFPFQWTNDNNYTLIDIRNILQFKSDIRPMQFYRKFPYLGNVSLPIEGVHTLYSNHADKILHDEEQETERSPRPDVTITQQNGLEPTADDPCPDSYQMIPHGCNQTSNDNTTQKLNVDNINELNEVHNSGNTSSPFMKQTSNAVTSVRSHHPVRGYGSHNKAAEQFFQ
jgi:hypothetical protein